jgi:hypothetical protein
VQRALSDLPDHPVLDRLLEAGPEPGDVDANEFWSSCLRACVASCLALSDQGRALKAFKRLLKLAEEIRTQMPSQPRQFAVTIAVRVGD